MNHTRMMTTLTAITITIIVIIPLSHLQSIQIHDITNNAGALLLQRGEGRIIAGYDRLLHIIDFPQFEISVSIFQNVINKIDNSTSDFTEIINLKLREIKSFFNTLKLNRNKRSIDMLGSAIKFITGNLDAEDLTIINENLDEIRKSGNSLVKQNNRQIKINSKFENRINIINNEIKNQQNSLRSILNKEDLIITEYQKLSVIFQMDTFLETLKSIEYAIMLAKMNIISKFVLTPKEIGIIAQEIRKQGLEVHSLDDASAYLTTTVLCKGSTIIISVNIPQLLAVTYQKVNLEPLPLSNHTAKFTYQTVFINKDQILAVTSRCQESQKVTICERKQLRDISQNACEARILRGRLGTCDLIENPPKSETRTIAPGTLLVLTVQQDVSINGTCGIGKEKLNGIHIITFHNCSLLVGNELFENHELQFHQPIILPLEPTKIQPQQIEKFINLTELHEINLKNRQYLETLKAKHLFGFAAISTLTICLFAFVAFGIIKYRQLTKTGNCSGRAILMGGRLKNEASTPTPIAAPTPAVRTDMCLEHSADSATSTPGNSGFPKRPIQASACILTTTSGARSADCRTVGRFS